MRSDSEEVAVEVVVHVLNKRHRNGKDFRDWKVREEHGILVRFLRELHWLDA